MLTNAAAKRSRASNEQLSHLVDFMLNTPGLAAGKFLKMHGKLETEKKWSELATSLNSLGGAVKTVQQWQTVWKDLKSRTSIKIRERKKQQAMTGNRPINEEPLTELEKRVVAIIGNDYIEGHNSVQENVPAQEEHQLLLEEGADQQFDLSISPTRDKLQCATPNATPSAPKRTPRYAKSKRREEEDSTKKQFLEIAGKQADALKLLAESSADNARALKMLAECSVATIEINRTLVDAVKGLAESMTSTANAVNAFANAINKLQ